MVEALYFAVDDVVDDLPDRHAGVDAYWLGRRNFQRPESAEADIAFSSRSVDVDTESPGRGFTFEEGDMLVSFSIFKSGAKIELSRLEDEAFFWDLEVANLVVLLCVQHVVDVLGEMLGEMHVVRVAAHVFGIKWRDDDFAGFDALKDLFVG